MDGMPYADIIVLALIAGFILLRLRSVLGQNTGDENPPPFMDYRKSQEEAPVVQADKLQQYQQEKAAEEALAAPLADTARSAVEAIRAQDASFTLAGFEKGARMAFEMVFDAFQKGDRDTLKMLMKPEVYGIFEQELNRRAQAESWSETTLVSILEYELLSAEMNKNIASLRVKFLSEQITVERGKSGDIVGGDASHTENVEDEWTFERDITSRNPNWKISDT